MTSSCSAQIMKDKNSSRSCPFECRILLVVTVLSQVKAPSLQSLTHWGSVPSPPPPPTPDPSSVGLPLRRETRTLSKPHQLFSRARWFCLSERRHILKQANKTNSNTKQEEEEEEGKEEEIIRTRKLYFTRIIEKIYIQSKACH